MRKALKILTVSVLIVAGFITFPLTAQAAKKVKKNSSTVTVTSINNAFVVSGNICVSNTGGNDQNHNDDNNRLSTASATATCTSSVNANMNVTVVAVGQTN